MLVRVHVARAGARACCQMVSEVLLVSVRVVRARARARARVVRVVRAGARACCQMGLGWFEWLGMGVGPAARWGSQT